VTRVRYSTRFLVVLAGALCGVPLAALLAGPALADSVPTTAYDGGPGLTVSETLGYFVGIPLLVIGIIYALVYSLTGRRGPRYPVSGPWSGPEEWFGDTPEGAAEPDAAVDAGDEPDGSAPAEGEGGARGRW
jgi:hypothetical protein